VNSLLTLFVNFCEFFVSIFVKSNPLHIMMQKVTKSMINSVNLRCIQHLDKYLQWLG